MSINSRSLNFELVAAAFSALSCPYSTINAKSQNDSKTAQAAVPSHLLGLSANRHEEIVVHPRHREVSDRPSLHSRDNEERS